MYYVISNSDGDTYVQIMTENEIIDMVKEECGEFLDATTLTRMDTNYWGGAKLIIKGDAVKPKPKEVVVDYELS